MKIKDTIKKASLGLILGLVTSSLVLTTTGCASQQTLAALVSTVGTSVATLEAIEGASPQLIQKVQQDTAIATQDVLNWKQGSPTQDIINALNLVQDDISVLPVPPQDAALVSLAIGTIDQILTIVQVSSGTTPVTTAKNIHFKLKHQIKNSKEFKKEWNSILATNPKAPVGAELN